MANTYPNSLITVYKTGIKKELNCYVDDLSTYLSSLTPIYSSPFTCQYIKHDLNLRVKVALGEGNQVAPGINYCRIQNMETSESPEQPMYYFIDDAKVISQNTLELNLTLDTVNSLGQQVNDAGKPSNFLKTTHIEREHEDRFKKPLSWDPATGGYLYRKIDKESEGTSPAQIKSGDLTLNQNNSNYDWYLVYKATGTGDKAVSTHLCASVELNVGDAGGQASKTITTSDLTNGIYYYIDGTENPGASFTYSVTVGGRTFNSTATIGQYAAVYYGTEITSSIQITGVKFWKSGSKILATFTGSAAAYSSGDLAYIDITMPGQGAWTFASQGVDSITITQLYKTRNSINGNIPADWARDIVPDTDVQWWSIGSSTTLLATSIDGIDRTDSKLIKIIKYPYCPIPFTKTGSRYDFGSDWELQNGFMTYKYTDLPSLGKTDVANFSLGETRYYFASSTIGKQKSKNNSLESKMYHSDFYTAKLVYDSFSLPIALERISPFDNASTTAVNVDFKPTSTINSKMAFKVNFEFGSYTDAEDYGKYLVCTRNNEETILNSDYINYIKNGYNYDKKSQAIQAENAQRQAIMTSVGSAAGITASLLGVAFGGPAIKATSLIGLGTSMVSGATSTVNAWASYNSLIENQNNAMAQKLAQLQAQSASVSGTDDVDLMSYYCSNRLHLMRYELNAQVKQALIRALDYTGYSHNVYDTPVVNTRIWYNYIKCTPMLKENDYRKSWANDLIERYKNGVTVFHKQVINDTNTWDFDQQYENFETWIVEGVN